MKFLILYACLFFLMSAVQATAQVAGEGEENVEEVVTIGTRVEAKDLAELAVPVEVIDEEEILATGHSEVGRVIQAIVASFNFSSSSISDGTDSLRPATLRGLGPDQVLVLVNGKRRHGSALIHINTSVGRGTSGYDLNSIPVAAIKRIEVLRDGASAQYGSDAVAGVINIILKKGAEGGKVRTSYGETYDDDGDTYVASISKGFNLYGTIPIFASFEFRKRGRTNRAGKTGAIQYPDTEYFTVGELTSRVKTSETMESNFEAPTLGSIQSGLSDALKAMGHTSTTTETGEDGVQYTVYDFSGLSFEADTFGLGGSGTTLSEASSTAKTDGINGNQLNDGDLVLSDSGADNDAEKSFNRRNFRIGDAESEQYSGSINFNLPAGRDAEIDVWATASSRENTSGGFYRRANQLDRNPANSDYPDGFLPLIETSIADWGGAVELTRKFDRSSMDFSIGGGWNKFDFNIKNSHNASYVNCVRNFDGLAAGTAPTSTSTGEGRAACAANGISAQDEDGPTPHSADAGGFELGLVNVNLDFRHPVDWGHFAWGVDYRTDFYKVNAGERYSYLDYDGGSDGSAGIQVFPGFKPENEVNEKRHSFGFYSDFETDIYNIVTLQPAVRIERYSDFGTTLNGKLAAKASPLWWLTLRGSMSSGFRAPSMQQLYFNNTSTQFDGAGRASEVGTFRNDSPLAREIGIPELEEEKSVNISGGFIVNPLPDFSLSADFYWIQVNDRIVISGQIENDDVSADIGENKAQFFMNAADTRTRGVDISASYGYSFLNGSTLRLLLTGSINETDITDINLPAGIPASLFTEQDRSIIESWQPKDRWTASATYKWNIVTATLAMHRYGKYTVLESNGQKQTYGDKYLNDAQLGFDFDKFGILKVGANNIFDIKPDRNEIGQSRDGVIVDHQGNVIVDTPGVFTYSRRAAPFGFNGGFYYVSYERNF